MYNESRGHHYFGNEADFDLLEFQERRFVVGGIVAAVIGVILAGVSTYMQMRQSQQAADEAEAISKQKEGEAVAARESAAFQEQQLRRRQQLLIGKNQAIAAAAGVDTSSGSPLFNTIDLTTQAELDALNVRRGGDIEAGARTFESRIAKFRAENSRAAIPFEIAGGVLQVASSATQGYMNYKYPGYQRRTVTSDWIGAS